MLRGRKLEWGRWRKTSLGRRDLHTSVHTWDCRHGVEFTRKDEGNLDLKIRVVNVVKLVKIR